MLEVLEPEYLKRLVEAIEQLVSVLQNLGRAGFDDLSRFRVRAELVDDGYVRVFDSSKSVDLLEVLREFSWVALNLAETNSLLKLNTPVTVLPSTTVTSNGDTTASPVRTDYGSVIVFFLDVTAVSGTNPTLDLYIDIQDPVSGKWVNQDKFPTVRSAGTHALAVFVRSNRYAVRWVLGGTSPAFTFSVGAVIIK